MDLSLCYTVSYFLKYSVFELHEFLIAINNNVYVLFNSALVTNDYQVYNRNTDACIIKVISIYIAKCRELNLIKGESKRGLENKGFEIFPNLHGRLY